MSSFGRRALNFGIWMTVIYVGFAIFAPWHAQSGNERWLPTFPGLTWVTVGVLAIAVGWLRSKHRRVSLEDVGRASAQMSAQPSAVCGYVSFTREH